jgi:hypothetical protein
MLPNLVEISGLQMEMLDEFPAALKTCEEMSELVGMDEDALRKYADSKQIPHYRFDNGQPKFRTKEVKQWLVSSGKVYRVPGQVTEHKVINYSVPSNSLKLTVPRELANLNGMMDIPQSMYPSGVYFLCDGEELVYIGQSVNPISRIATHRHEGRKEFTHAFLLPVPEYELNNVEGAMIRHLKPKYNGRNGTPRGDESDEEVLKKLLDMTISMTKPTNQTQDIEVSD